MEVRALDRDQSFFFSFTIYDVLGENVLGCHAKEFPLVAVKSPTHRLRLCRHGQKLFKAPRVLVQRVHVSQTDR
jgi:hypothetical protein